jgi:L-lactate dehydrogenase
MSRFLQKQTSLLPEKVIGLGTVVETARIRRALAETVGDFWNARQLWPFAIGTHDENFVPVFTDPLFGPGCYFNFERYPRTLNQIADEVKLAAKRVKEARQEKTGGINEYTIGTMFPIVEGAFQVVKSIAVDQREVLTVSVFDCETDFYYSLPSVIGREGVIHVHKDFLENLPHESKLLKKAIAKLGGALYEKE